MCKVGGDQTRLAAKMAMKGLNKNDTTLFKLLFGKENTFSFSPTSQLCATLFWVIYFEVVVMCQNVETFKVYEHFFIGPNESKSFFQPYWTTEYLEIREYCILGRIETQRSLISAEQALFNPWASSLSLLRLSRGQSCASLTKRWNSVCKSEELPWISTLKATVGRKPFCLFWLVRLCSLHSKGRGRCRLIWVCRMSHCKSSKEGGVIGVRYLWLT